MKLLTKGFPFVKVEELVRNLSNLPVSKPAKKAAPISFEYQKLQRELTSKFSTRVKLKVSENGKGAIEIPFGSEDDLSRILELLDW